MSRSTLSLLASGFLQVFFVGFNMKCVAYGHVLGLVLSSFFINWLWSHNVKKIAFGSEVDRVAYALGGCSGCVAGFYAAQLLAALF